MPAEDRVLRFSDYERRSREPDALGPRDPSETAVIIILPMIRVERPYELEQRGAKPR